MAHRPLYRNPPANPHTTFLLLLLLPLLTPTLAAKNFIFFQPDEMRAESVGAYNNTFTKTPNFDKFANQGTRFNQAHTSHTVCSQSRVAFVTGWPTHVAGHRSLWSLLHSTEPNLFKYFKKYDYQVHWWGKNDMMADDSWNTSVTTAREMKGINNGPNTYNLEDPEYYSMLTDPTQGSVNQTQDYNNVFEAINFLKSYNSDTDDPFFIFLPLLNPHPPYSVPEPFYSLIDPETINPLRPTDNDGSHPDYHSLIRQYRNLTSLDDAFWKKLHAVYLGSIAFSDFLFGELMTALDDTGLADDTVVTVFSDHGDYAGDYGLVEKWPSGLEDVLTRVPLIIRAPGGVANNVHEEQVQLFDIVPTMLEFAGIEAQHIHFGVSLHDNVMKGEAGDPDRAVFAEGGYGTNEPRDFEGDSSNGGIPAIDTDYYPKVLQEQEHPLSVCR
ncbi:hypothetical protein TL16_g13242 [Triparma laevis f. inornata]|nr:hypothetical protein TL16_g13242 [Triparma laevis f. inornata]